MKRYCLGFLFDLTTGDVLLIDSTKTGCLNGIGGKIEEGETPLAAMVRESGEEAHQVREWEPFLSFTDERWYYVHTFRCCKHLTPAERAEFERTTSEGTTRWIPLADVFSGKHPMRDNLAWIVPLAFTTRGLREVRAHVITLE